MFAAQAFVVVAMAAALGGPREVKPEAEYLSDMLSANLAMFVQQAGSDRRVVALTAEELEVVRDPSLDPGAFVQILQPVSTTTVRRPVELVGTRGPVGAETLAVAGPGTVLDEAEVAIGEQVCAGQTFHAGWIFNAGDSTLVFADADGNEIEIPPGGALAVPCVPSCSVGCSSGFYACCWASSGPGVNNCAHCHCIANGTSSECQAGGPGATSCSIDLGRALTLEPAEGLAK